MLEAARLIGTGLAITGLIGAGIGIVVVLGALILGVARNPSLRGQLFSYAILWFAYLIAFIIQYRIIIIFFLVLLHSIVYGQTLHAQSPDIFEGDA